MSFRLRVFLLVFSVVGLFLALLGFWARRQLVVELEREHARRVATEVAAVERVLHGMERDLDARLEALGRHLQGDSRFRLALLRRTPEERRALVDAAGERLPLTGLDFLEILDERSVVLSSASYRESHGAERKGARALAGPDLVRVLVPEPGGRRAGWGRGRTLEIAGASYIVWGGIGEEDVPLPPGVRTEDGPGGDAVAATFTRSEVDLAGGATRPYNLAVVASRQPLADARNALDRTLLAAAAAVFALALFVSWIVSRWIERPIGELADKVLSVRVGRENVGFDTGRSDEIGDLGRFIGSMVQRLRESSERLREADRRAALGDIARQVHHDVKNGVVPLRGVIRHLTEAAEREPERLASVFVERAGTLESGLTYLEELSTRYARLTQKSPLVAVDVRAALAELRETLALERPELAVKVEIEAGTPPVQADPLGLRRVLENLVRNAIDAMNEADTRAPRLSLRVRPVSRREQVWVEIAVEDNGPGIAAEVRERIFEPFFTTRPSGTGLGLSIVRRLINDFGGRVDVETRPGEGTTFRLLLPAAAG